MNQSTVDDLNFLHNEEAARAYIHFVTPLIQAAVAAAMPPELSTLVNELTQARSDLDTARAELQEAKSKFITADEAHKIGQAIGDTVSASVDRNMADLKEDDQRRSQAFDAQIGEVRALSLTQGHELATLKAVFEEKIEAHEKRLTKVENDIKTGVSEVARNSRTMSRLVGQWLEESRKQKEKSDSDLKALQEALLETKDDALNLRGDVDGLRGDIATKVTTVDLKVKNIEAQTVEIKQRQSDHTAEQALLKTWVIDIQVQTKSIGWLLNSWTGRILITAVLTLLGVTNLVN